MPDDILLNKAAIIRRCLARVREDYAGDPKSLLNQTRQDAIVLNLQRACEAAIDLAMHLVAERNLGVPQTSRDAFSALENASILPKAVATRMRAMVGFRNIAIHDYQRLQLPILERIVVEHLGDFEAFIDSVK